MSTLGYFNSKILGSIEGYIIPFLVALSMSYTFPEYPEVFSHLFVINIDKLSYSANPYNLKNLNKNISLYLMVFLPANWSPKSLNK